MSWGALAGAVISGGLSFLGARKANQQAQQLSREQMAFEERMSNTAYQRSMADMKAAGLNPMLAYQQGGASTPHGSVAPVMNEMEGAVNSAQRGAAVSDELKQLRALTKQSGTQANLNEASTALAEQNNANAKDQQQLIRAQTGTQQNLTRKTAADADAAVSNAHTAAEQARAARYLTDRAKADIANVNAQSLRTTTEAEQLRNYGRSQFGGFLSTLGAIGNWPPPSGYRGVEMSTPPRTLPPSPSTGSARELFRERLQREGIVR